MSRCNLLTKIRLRIERRNSLASILIFKKVISSTTRKLMSSLQMTILSHFRLKSVSNLWESIKSNFLTLFNNRSKLTLILLESTSQIHMLLLKKKLMRSKVVAKRKKSSSNIQSLRFSSVAWILNLPMRT